MPRPLFFVVIVGVLLSSTVACGNVGIYNPQATQAALQSTVTAMQATVIALEAANQANQAQAVVEPSPQIVVVTATPVDTPTPTPAANPSPTPEPAATASPTPTASPTSTRPQPIVIVVTPTSTVSPASGPYDRSPILIAPGQGAVVEEGREIILQWSWNGLLGSNEHFDIKIRPDGQTRSAYVAWEDGEGHNFMANLAPGRYFWSVQVIRGYYKNNSHEPEDRVFEAFLGPESEPRLIIVTKREENPRSVSQADPPLPSLPYGLAAGSLIFILFVGVTRRRLL